MNSGVFSIGSNCGDRAANVERGVKELSSLLCGEIMSSDVYETACALSSNRKYCNCVISGCTELTLSAMEECLKRLEIKLGRTDECRKRGEVPVDIDIVVWNGKIIRDWDFGQSFFKKGYNQISGSAFINI